MKFMFKPEVVAAGLITLRSCKIHPHFNGYLATKWTAVKDGRETDLQPKFTAYFDQFWRVPDFPAESPYLIAFRNNKSEQLTFNKNVAGSYAPSSLRATLAHVIEIEGAKSDAKYSLRSGHAKLALKHLCYDQALPIYALCALLYRDFAFEGEPHANIVGETFKADFGFPDIDDKTDDDLQTLFVNDKRADTVWEFEILADSD